MSSPPRASGRRSAADRRDQLLAVATRLVAERGFYDISIEAIAADAGVTRATVYNHFRDLQDLLEAVIELETSRALAQVSETTLTSLDEGDPQELMLEALAAYLHAVQSAPTTWRLVLMPPEGAPAALHDKIADGRAAVLCRIVLAVRPITDRGSADHDAELTARILSAVSDEYARLVLTDPERFPPARLLEHARWWIGTSALVAKPKAGNRGASPDGTVLS